MANVRFRRGSPRGTASPRPAARYMAGLDTCVSPSNRKLHVHGGGWQFGIVGIAEAGRRVSASMERQRGISETGRCVTVTRACASAP